MNKESLRLAYGEKLLEMAGKNENIVVLDADLSGSTMSNYIAGKYPERFFEMSIAEQNMISVAAGLSLTGKIPFVNSFAVFAAGRPYDQIRQGVALPKLNVKICGSSCGLSDYGDGATHQSIEDIAIMRAIPNMVVVNPADAEEVRKVVTAAVEYNGPVYIRINRNDLPVITDKVTEFKFGNIYQMCDGSDLTVFASGIMVSKALEAAEQLSSNEGIYLRVYNVPTIKPLDKNAIIKAVEGVKGIVTAEEHSIIGGLGSAVSEVLDQTPIPLVRVGINDRFGQSASDYDQLLVEYGLTVDDIISACKHLLIE